MNYNTHKKKKKRRSHESIVTVAKGERRMGKLVFT